MHISSYLSPLLVVLFVRYAGVFIAPPFEKKNIRSLSVLVVDINDMHMRNSVFIEIEHNATRLAIHSLM